MAQPRDIDEPGASRTPHDALFKAVFSKPSRAMDEVRAVVAPEVVRHLALEAAELVPGSFVDDALKERHADLLFRVPIGEREAFAYLLFEHQSEPDALMPYRLLRYMARIWERWLGEHPGATRLPAILPLVLSHSPRGWTAARSLGETYDLEPAAIADFARWLPGFDLPIDDLSRQSDEALRGRVTDALATLAVLMLKHSRTGEDLGALLLSWDELVRRVLRAPSGVAAFALVLRYLLVVAPVNPKTFGRLLGKKAGPKAEQTMKTAADVLLEQGERRGLKKGVKQGLQQGVKQGLQQVLVRQLGLRFGELAPSVVARVRAASTEQVELWADRVLTAATLDDVFAAQVARATKRTPARSR